MRTHYYFTVKNRRAEYGHLFSVIPWMYYNSCLTVEFWYTQKNDTPLSAISWMYSFSFVTDDIHD